MAKYEKDNSGDPRSPINGRIQGLFFACNETSPCSLPTQSYFGSTRIRVPVSFFLSPEAKRSNIRTYNMKIPRLYFADIYCMAGTFHWITLVLTYEHSPADRFCSRHLPELDLHNNTFLCIKPDGTVKKRTGHNLNTEVFYTEDVDLGYWQTRGGVIESVTQLGTSRRGGKRKVSGCSICNLRTHSARSTSQLHYNNVLFRFGAMGFDDSDSD